MTNFVMPSAWPNVLLKTVLIPSSLNQGLLIKKSVPKPMILRKKFMDENSKMTPQSSIESSLKLFD